MLLQFRCRFQLQRFNALVLKVQSPLQTSAFKLQGFRCFSAIGRKIVVHSPGDESLRLAAANQLAKSAFSTMLDSLKASLAGGLITPNDAKQYMEARNRPYNDDVRGLISESMRQIPYVDNVVFV